MQAVNSVPRPRIRIASSSAAPLPTRYGPAWALIRQLARFVPCGLFHARQIVPARHYHVLLLLISWHLWKHRNAVVFNNESASHARFWNACKEDAQLWSHRWPHSERAIADVWCSVFSSM
ncbi:unnamed protein product [Urochloa humidicola]